MAEPTPKELFELYEKHRVAVAEALGRVESDQRNLDRSKASLERASAALKELHDRVAPMIASETARLLGDGA